MADAENPKSGSFLSNSWMKAAGSVAAVAAPFGLIIPFMFTIWGNNYHENPDAEWYETMLSWFDPLLNVDGWSNGIGAIGHIASGATSDVVGLFTNDLT